MCPEPCRRTAVQEGSRSGRADHVGVQVPRHVRGPQLSVPRQGVQQKLGQLLLHCECVWGGWGGGGGGSVCVCVWGGG